MRGDITLVGGRAKTSRTEYGCSMHAQRGDSVCRNNLRIQRHELEERLNQPFHIIHAVGSHHIHVGNNKIRATCIGRARALAKHMFSTFPEPGLCPRSVNRALALSGAFDSRHGALT
jgi:hypothetical protein